jgi:glucose/arabinose dehydrogenase
MFNTKFYLLAVLPLILMACEITLDEEKVENKASKTVVMKDTAPAVKKIDLSVKLPKPYATKAVINFSKVIDWPAGVTPKAPEGFVVTKFADGLNNPRWIYVGPNGDVFVSEANKTAAKVVEGFKTVFKPKSKSANRITMFRDTDKDGIFDLRETFLDKLNQPFGMLILGNYFYVANTDGVLRFPYKVGETYIRSTGVKILDLPKGGYNNHWTRNIIANEKGTKIYVSVGSGSNVAEHGMGNEIRRANILEINPNGSGEKIYASGLRNPVGMDWAPGTHTLWTAVNERDNLGDDLVPDYITGVKKGAFYGWPFSYYGKHEDPRRKGERPDLVKKAIVPDVPLGSHTASLGLVFYKNKMFPARYRNGAFIGQHGSWNRSELTGYKVIFVPFSGGQPSGRPEDFLTGFIADTSKNKVYGRPVGVAVLQDGSLLVADDASNIIWKISKK